MDWFASNARYVPSGLMRNAEAAFEKRDYSAANRALELLGKHLRLWGSQTQVMQANVHLDDDSLRKLLEALFGAESSLRRARALYTFPELPTPSP